MHIFFFTHGSTARANFGRKCQDLKNYKVTKTMPVYTCKSRICSSDLRFSKLALAQIYLPSQAFLQWNSIQFWVSLIRSKKCLSSLRQRFPLRRDLPHYALNVQILAALSERPFMNEKLAAFSVQQREKTFQNQNTVCQSLCATRAANFAKNF